jgi:hypothetical protein
VKCFNEVFDTTADKHSLRKKEGLIVMEEKTVELKCSCGETMQGFLGEEYNHKETLHCKCGKRYILLELTKDE